MPRTRRTAWQWAFQSRQTGRTTLAQWPNPPLWTWIVASLLRRLTPVSGWADEGLTAVADLGLGGWAALEVWSGVNPWRRLLGLGVLVSLALSLLR